MYAVAAGWMLLFVYLVRVLGAVGNGMRRVVKRPDVPLAGCARSLRNRKVATVVASALIVAAHLKSFSVPVTFREITLKGEEGVMAVLLLLLFLSLYIDLGPALLKWLKYSLL